MNKTFGLTVLLLSITNLSIGQFVHPVEATKDKQFNFWIGEWDVNLSIKQKDGTWQEKVKSVARIYPILGGRAILELWDESDTGIIGYSLRYYNHSENKWDLWLNWPGKNRSGTSGMQGNFTHGRGEFFSTRQLDDSTSLISRYTFSDVTPVSLRWDDAYSRDDEQTWTNNWIMRFNRRHATASELTTNKKPLTYYKGQRCDTKQFEILNNLEGSYQDGSTSMTIYPYLDGCAVMGFIKNKSKELFFTLTYNTYAAVYEFGVISNEISSAFNLYYGSLEVRVIRLAKQNSNASTTLDIGQNNILIRSPQAPNGEWRMKKVND